MLSIIIPVYNEEKNISKCATTIKSILYDNKIEYQIIFINDGSQDNSWNEIEHLCQQDNNICAIDLTRNFGKENAIFAGLKNASGDACVIIDCDLQHPPQKIIDMYNLWKNNDIDIVDAKKIFRGKESIFKKASSKLFYKLIKLTSHLELENSSDFKLLDRRVVDSLNEMPERLTFFRAMSSWVGFKTETIYFDVDDRQKGSSSWSYKKLFNYAIRSITSYTSAPLQIVTVIGIVTFIISVCLGIQTLYNKFSGHSAEGFSTVILLQLFTSSVIMFSLGIIGYYISKIYEEIKSRPRYLINKKINIKHK